MPRRDEQGPDHSPAVWQLTEIEGVIVSSSPFVRYLEDNVLTELYRPEWPGIFLASEPIEHLYSVRAPSGGMRQEWYFHEHTLDRYNLLSGRLDIGLYDARNDSATFGNFVVISLGEPGSGLPNGIRIPPLVWHSLRWETENGLFLNAKLPGYERQVPDKFRIQPEDYPDAIVWNRQSKTQ